MVPAGSIRISRVPIYSGYYLEVWQFRVRDSHPLWFIFPSDSTIAIFSVIVVLQPRSGRNPCGLGFSDFARHYSRNHCYFLFLQVLRCFSSLRLLSVTGMYDLPSYGFPHSDICGSSRMCQSPQLFAAYHVLLRL